MFRCGCGLALLLVLPPAFSVAQVAFVGVVVPPGTPTMVGRAIEAGHWPAREVRSLSELGRALPNAVLAAEDARFFLHDGFDWEALCDAVGGAQKGKRLRGASTVSQQTAKNLFLWQGRSYVRKVLEVWYTLLLESMLSKERILALYLNVAETGPMVFGAEAGAKHHFGKPASQLTADQAGRLAGILPDPRDRSVTGSAAVERAQFVARNPVPWPGDPGFERLRTSVRERNTPWHCVR